MTKTPNILPRLHVYLFTSSINESVYLCEQVERLNWSSTRFSWDWTGTVYSDRRPSSSLIWSLRRTPAILTVRTLTFVWVYPCSASLSLNIISLSLCFSAVRALSAHQLLRRGRHQWRWAGGDKTVLFLLASLQQGQWHVHISCFLSQKHSRIRKHTH